MPGSTFEMNEINIGNLKCEYETTPMGVQNPCPLLGWQIRSDRPVMQSACRIVASSSEENLRAGIYDLMDTGKTASTRSFGVPYNGKPLESAMRVYWMVRIWTQDDEESGWSDFSWFEMGLLKESDWKGLWLSFLGGMVGNGLLVRHHFELKEKEVAYARAYVACVGYYEFHMNGKVLSDRKYPDGGSPGRRMGAKIYVSRIPVFFSAHGRHGPDSFSAGKVCSHSTEGLLGI